MLGIANPPLLARPARALVADETAREVGNPVEGGDFDRGIRIDGHGSSPWIIGFCRRVFRRTPQAAAALRRRERSASFLAMTEPVTVPLGRGQSCTVRSGLRDRKRTRLNSSH